ncbi:metallophosphoesterase [Sandaracinobacteroides saxicola]|uniref:Metallophosphoesterase n=1 Tax=Sandaracinobacteroides saxicola TaxID=2759707 RepID=A0A7G5ILI7_9SPHN|nr:metallophosphoesterase [Sandaracinobacteroides saxicola]QMW24229.1 metallophosphoesterase [Sandaracinobacteroides saxicola]
MLIAQISDLHIGFDVDNPNERNLQRLNAVLDILIPMAPACLLVTGDLTEFGSLESYRRLHAALARCPFPIFAGVGNHDRRDEFAQVFTATGRDADHVHYTADLPGLRLVMLDTLDPGHHGGAFCESRAGWLRARLAEAPDTPTLLILHHPPIPTGIAWMTAFPQDPWVMRLESIVRANPQIRRVVAGHIHRALLRDWAGTTVAVCPSTSPQVALDFRAMADHPDGRPMIVDEPPAFAIHQWDGSGFTTHFGVASGQRALARYDLRMKPVVEHIMAEHPAPNA